MNIKEAPFRLSPDVAKRISGTPLRDMPGELALTLGRVVLNGIEAGEQLALCVFDKGTHRQDDFYAIENVPMAIEAGVVDRLRGRELVFEKRIIENGETQTVMWFI